MILRVLQLQGTSVENKVRTITKAYLDFDEKRNFLIFTFSGNGFLYKQIRNMVGTLLKIGNKRMPVEQIDRILTEKIVIWLDQQQHQTGLLKGDTI